MWCCVMAALTVMLSCVVCTRQVRVPREHSPDGMQQLGMHSKPRKDGGGGRRGVKGWSQDSHPKCEERGSDPVQRSKVLGDSFTVKD